MALFPGFANVYNPYVHLYLPDSTVVLTAAILHKANNMENISSIK